VTVGAAAGLLLVVSVGLAAGVPEELQAASHNVAEAAAAASGTTLSDLLNMLVLLLVMPGFFQLLFALPVLGLGRIVRVREMTGTRTGGHARVDVIWLA
jgi:hypothetical protein